MLLWLWCRPTAVSLIRPLASGQLLKAMGVTPEKAIEDELIVPSSPGMPADTRNWKSQGTDSLLKLLGA